MFTNNKKNMQKIVLVSTLVLSLSMVSGCTSTVASLTGSDPVGVRAGDRTFSQRLRDSGIEKNAMVNLYKLDKRFRTNSRVEINAFHDAVLITGQVPDVHMKNLATDNVRAIREVKVVHNELEVGPEASYSEILNDNVIGASIRKNLLLVPGLKESRVKVVVEKGIVYLMGVLDADETQIVLATVQKTNGIKKIISLIDSLEELEKQYQNRRLASASTHSLIPSSKLQAPVVNKATMNKSATTGVQTYTLQKDNGIQRLPASIRENSAN